MNTILFFILAPFVLAFIIWVNVTAFRMHRESAKRRRDFFND